MTIDVGAARTFLRANARILEVRLAEVYLDTAQGPDANGSADPTPALGALSALAAYRNADGAFGQSLEPDVRAPESQPLAVDFAYTVLDDILDYAGEHDIVWQIAADTAAASLPFLASVADEDGGLPIVLPNVASHPRASHWADGVFPAALNPTAGIVARARMFGLDHPWIEAAALFCRREIEAPGAVSDAHTALEVLRFAETEPDELWAQKVYSELGERLNQLAFFQALPGHGYGLTPLHFAPAPDSPRRHFFSDVALLAHLEALEAGQTDDGGWDITWEPPSPGAVLEWRGIETLRALQVLRSYGRI